LSDLSELLRYPGSKPGQFVPFPGKFANFAKFAGGGYQQRERRLTESGTEKGTGGAQGTLASPA
jgi:hypothetical protein